MLASDISAMNDCLCRQVFRHVPLPPKMRHKSCSGEYIIYCPSCGFKTHPDINKQSVITDWICSNTPNNKQTETLWVERYEKQTGTSIGMGY